MKINKIQGTKDFNYSNEELEKDELYINGNRSGGIYNLNVRTNKLKYEICLLNINEGREKLSVTLIYDENMLREGLNKVTRLNVESFLTYDEAKDEYKLFGIDGSLSLFKKGSNDVTRYYNNTKKNGEVMYLEGEYLVIEDLLGDEYYYKDNKLVSIRIKQSEEYITYVMEYTEGKITGVVVNNKVVNISYTENFTRITYLNKLVYLYGEVNKVSKVKLANGLEINLTYDQTTNKIKKVCNVLESEVSDKVEFIYNQGYIERIIEYRVANRNQRIVYIEKRGNNFIINEMINNNFYNQVRGYVLSSEDGHILYSYEPSSKDILKSNLVINIDEVYKGCANIEVTNKIFEETNYSLCGQGNRIEFSEIEEKGIRCCVLVYEIENPFESSDDDIEIKVIDSAYFYRCYKVETIKNEGESVVKGAISFIISDSSSIRNVYINIEKSGTPFQGNEILKSLRVYPVKQYTSLGVDVTDCDVNTGYQLTIQDTDDQKVLDIYYAMKNISINGNEYKLNENELIINHINCLKARLENKSSFRCFINDFTDSLLLPIDTSYILSCESIINFEFEINNFSNGLGIVTFDYTCAEIKLIDDINNNQIVMSSYSYDGEKYIKSEERYNNNLCLLRSNVNGLQTINTVNSYGEILEKRVSDGIKYFLNKMTYSNTGLLINEIKQVKQEEVNNEYEYDNYQRVIKYVDEEGIEQTYTYGALDEVLTLTRDEKTNILKYNKELNLQSERTSGGEVYEYVYDEYLNLIEVKDRGVSLYQLSYEVGSTTSSVILTSRKGLVRKCTYDKIGHLLKVEEGTSNNDLTVVVENYYSSNDYGKLQEVEFKAALDLINDVEETSLNKDSSSKLVKSVTSRGTKYYIYDEYGNIKKVIENDYEYELAKNNKNEVGNYRYVNGEDILNYENEIDYAENRLQKRINATTILKQEMLANVAGARIYYQEDTFNRLTGEGIINLSNNLCLSKLYNYYEASNRQSNQIKEIKYYQGESLKVRYGLNYDKLGRIVATSEFDEGGNIILASSKTYQYDNVNRLSRLISGNQDTYVYTYDNRSNIASRTKNGVIDKAFTYDDRNRILTYNNIQITYYDNTDNITNIEEGIYNSSLTWSKGRLLSYIYSDENEEGEIYTYFDETYNYDEKGRLKERVIKESDYSTSYNIKYHYDENNRLVKYEYGSDVYLLLYDKYNKAIGFINNDKVYSYIRNSLSEIVKILDSNLNDVVSYEYDEYGKIISIKGSLKDTLGARNPLRYKDYIYLEKTKFYYINSRYYNPEWCRFISQDDVSNLDSSSINGLNLYSYCYDNPVNYKQRPVSKTISNNSVHLRLSHYISSKTVETKTSSYSYRLKNTNKMNKLADPVVNPLYDGQLIQFDYSENPDYNIFTSFYYAYKLYENGLPAGRTIEGIWFELLGHYIIHKLDIFDLTDRDDVADMGSYKYDNNAYIWENIIHGIMQGLENWYYDKW